MCGICGIVRFDGGAMGPDALDAACAALSHRGPDHAGHWIEPRGHGMIGLGATRLCILDPSPAANQPMHDPSGRFHLAYNGEIYNFRALRRELADAGWAFRTQSDTEVVLAACASWGADAATRFNGMWALAFYDGAARTGFLSRDRFGIKPLFYQADQAGLCFASELRAMEALRSCDAGLDPDAAVQHLVFGYIAHPATIYRGVKRLPPGCSLSFGPAGWQEPAPYYKLRTSGSTPRCAWDYCAARSDVRRALADAVVARRVADVPVGALLSGGLDSSIVVYHLAEATGRPIETFSVGYEGQSSYDETSYARQVANRLGTEHHELILSQTDVLESIPAVLDHLGEPVGDSSIVPTSLVSRFARGRVTAALSGDAGDELFGGYWRYLAHDALRAYDAVPPALRRWLIEPLLAQARVQRAAPLANRARQFRKLLRGRGADPVASHVAWSRILSPEAEALLQNGHAVEACVERTVERARSLTRDMPKTDWLNRILAFDIQHSLPADMLQKVDLASMMHSLEVRIPFLDPAVVDRAMSLPSHWKIDRGRRKRILVDAYRGLLPDEVLDRPKQGFEVPVAEYFRGPLRDLFHQVVTRGTVDAIGLLNYPAVESLMNAHLARREDHADVLWALLSLCWWQGRRRRR